jgi:hypothetical protein
VQIDWQMNVVRNAVDRCGYALRFLNPRLTKRSNFPFKSMNTPPPLPDAQKSKLTWYEHVWVAWPLALIAVGGAIGGACGGAAWALNQKVFRQTQHPLLRYLWTGMISGAALLAYLVLATIFFSLIHKAK